MIAVDNLPLISVVICTSERPHCLKLCLKSIITQTYPNYQVIVVDKSRQDNTDSIREIIPHAKYIRQKTEGIAAARRMASECSEGEFIAFTDDDCIADKDWLRQLHIKQKQEDLDIVGGVSLYKDTDEVHFKIHSISRYGQLGDYNHRRHDKKFWYIGLNTTNILIKKEVFRRVNFDPYYLYYFEEEDFVTRAQLSGFKIGYTDAAVVRHYPSDIGWYREDVSLVIRNINYYSVKNFGISLGLIIHRIISILKTIRWFIISGQKDKIAPLIKYTFIGIIDGVKARKSINQ